MICQSKLFFEALLLVLELLSWTVFIELLRQIYRRGAINDSLQGEKWEGQVPLGMASHISINVHALTLRPFSHHSLHDWMIFTHHWCTSQHHSKQWICSLSVTIGCVGYMREWLIFEQVLLGRNFQFSHFFFIIFSHLEIISYGV